MSKVSSTRSPSADGSTTETASADALSAGGSSTETASADAPPVDGSSTELESAGAPSADGTSTEAASADAPSAEGSLTESASVDAPSADGSSTEPASADAPSAGGSSTEPASVDAPSAEGSSTESASVDAPSADAPAKDVSSTDAASGNTPSADTPSSPPMKEGDRAQTEGERPQAVIVAKALVRTFEQGRQKIEVLRGVDLTVGAGEGVALIGASGSGKSTLLHCLGGLDTPDSGEVMIAGHSAVSASERERLKLRNEAIGFVYQFHHLLAEFSVLENVALPLLIRGLRVREAKRRAQAMIEKTGIESRAKHRPAELSGGERQRTAIARALVTEPSCVLADEPTGNLDRQTAETVFDLMRSLNRDLGTGIVVATHDLSLAKRMDRAFRITDGRLVPVDIPDL